MAGPRDRYDSGGRRAAPESEHSETRTLKPQTAARIAEDFALDLIERAVHALAAGSKDPFARAITQSFVDAYENGELDEEQRRFARVETVRAIRRELKAHPA